MVQLNLCYEALTKRRAEYNAAKGIGMADGPGYSGARGPHWRQYGGPETWRGQDHPYKPEAAFYDSSMDEDERIARQWMSVWHQLSHDGKIEVAEMLEEKRRRKRAKIAG